MKKQYKQELLATFKALPLEVTVAMMAEITSEMVEESKDEEEGEEAPV